MSVVARRRAARRERHVTRKEQGIGGRWLLNAAVSGLLATSVVLAVESPAAAITASVTGTAVTSGGDGLTTTDFEYNSSGTLGSGTMHFDFVLIFEGSRLRTEGTGTLTRSDGATFMGSETSTVDLSSFPFPVVITFDVTSGTGALGEATGEIVLTGTSRGPGVVGDVFAMRGTLNIPLPVPTDKQQCKRGGWRNLQNGQAKAFRNQGQCVAFVNHARRVSNRHGVQ
jgi:hypothetical protein